MRLERVVPSSEDGADAIALVKKDMRQEAIDRMNRERLVGDVAEAAWDARRNGRGEWVVSMTVRAVQPEPAVTNVQDRSLDREPEKTKR